MNNESKNILKKSWKGSRAVLGALVLISVTPLLVLAVEVWLIRLRVGQEEWKMLACLSGLLIGCGVFFFSLAAAIRWLTCWRNARRALLSLGFLATFIVMFYSEEDWRGWHAWKSHVREHAAKGEKIELSAFIPPAVPDDQNFCACPLLKPIMDFTRVNGQVTWRDTNGLARVQALHPWFASNGAPPAITNGLIGWQTYYRSLANLSDLSLTNSPAEDVLLVLRRFEPALAELKREAAVRPADRWNINYGTDSPWSILLPHLANVRGICSLLQLRATARFASGDVPGALSDLQLGFRLANSLRAEPFLISHLVRNACWDILLEPLKDGLRSHQLSDGQLRDLQRELLSADFLAGYQLATCGERSFNGAWMNLNWQQCDELARGFGAEFGKPFYSVARFSSIAPRGWIYQNQITLCRIYDDFIVPAVDIPARTVPPGRTRALILATRQGKGPYSVLASLVFQLEAGLGDPNSRCNHFAYSQTQIDEALIACALERYRLLHGEYPETLDSLAPQFIARIPHDIINGQPLHFRPTPGGGYLLYSVGWNETDDGGRIVRKSDGQVDVPMGDWAW